MVMRRREFIVLLGADLLGARVAYARSEPPKSYDVFRGDRLVLTIQKRPGPLVSSAEPPPGRRPVPHPFLSGSAHAADEEPSLREILEHSRDFGDFTRRLRRAGYSLRERTSARPSR
jgi:hypothetical protein